MEKHYYSETIPQSDWVRQRYVDGVNSAVAQLKAHANAKREAWATPANLAANRETFRKTYAEMLGIPVLEEVFGTGAPESIEEFPVATDDVCTITRMIFHLKGDVVLTGLMLRPHNAPAQARLVIGQHGGGGAPELCSDLVGKNNYNHMVRRVMERGAVVFCPQLLLWNYGVVKREGGIPHFEPPFDRQRTDAALKQCGSSIAAFEIYAISRVLTALLARPDVKSDGCGMIGISYGGFYTLYTMAYEPRIISGYSIAFFNDRMKYGWGDFVWPASGTKFNDPEVAALCAPRRLWLEVGKKDPVFDNSHVTDVFDKVVPFFEAAGCPDEVRLNLWEGGHTLDNEDIGLEWFFEALN